MVHPVKTPLNAARALTRATWSVARHPVRTVGGVVSTGRGYVAAVASVVAGTRRDSADLLVDSEDPIAKPAPDISVARLKKQGDALTRITRQDG